MNRIEIISGILLVLTVVIYLFSIFKKSKTFKTITHVIKKDIKSLSKIITNPVFDQLVVKFVKELIFLVEEKNQLAKQIGSTVLTGIEKKNTVISKLTELISGITGSLDTATSYVSNHQNQLETLIDDYVAFSNKMKQTDELNKDLS